MRKPNLKIAWCSHEAALFAVKRWHYSRCLPACSLVKLGVWEDDKFIGSVIYSKGASPHLLTRYRLNNLEGCELTRIALNGHITPVTKIVSISMKMMKEKCPSLRLIVSFADQGQGHVGKIYQAGNWIYCGVVAPNPEYYINGRWMHKRNASPIRARTGIKYPKRMSSPKYRYLMPLDKQMRKQIESLRQPYPKSAPSKDSVAGSSQLSEGGASPTGALQLNEVTA